MVGGGALRDDPEAYIPGDRRRALAAGRELPERVHGAALFADISGFTPLTEALAAELGPQRGAEELTAVLDTVVGEILGELHRYGGSVIYFSGDAVTCWLDGDDGLLATRCALGMQEAMARVGRVQTPGGRRLQLAMKVAVAVGPARRFVVGDPSVQLIDVLAGALMDRLAETEHAAVSDEVVVDESVLAAVGGSLIYSERRHGPHLVGVVSGLAVDVPPRPTPPPPGPLPADVVRQWLLPPVYERMQAGRGEFLSELRPAIPLFLRFEGLDFDEDEASVEKLREFIARAQRIVDEYGGSTLQLTVGDKGAYLYAVFGSPIGYGDEAARVCGAALDLVALETETAVTGLQIGVTQGRLRSGTYGHQQRRTFCCLGDAVNLAARLMSAAPAGTIYVSSPVRAAAGTGYSFLRLADLSVKGKQAPVAVWALTGRVPPAEQVRTGERQRLVGRDGEFAGLTTLLDAAAGPVAHGALVGLSAEAGVGKSRLAAELAARAAARGVRVAYGVAQTYGTSAAYAAWQELWRDLLDLGGEPAEVDPAVLARRLPADLVPRLPLLGTLLGVPLPDNELTTHFDAKLRKASLESFAVRLLEHLAARRPLLLVLEEAHRLDPLSRDLLVALTRALPPLPVVVVLTYRPTTAPYAGLDLDGFAHATEVRLPTLAPEATAQAVADRLTLLYGVGQPIAPEVVALVAERSEGNPLYVRELCSYLHERGLDPALATALDALELPESLHSLVLSRIDQLAEAPRRAAKVASVVGRTFRGPLLPRVYPELGEDADVELALGDLVVDDVVLVEDRDAAGYAFSHPIVCDVAYESLPFAMREVLHEGVARSLEAGAEGDPDRQLDRLAHHYGRSANQAKKRQYLLAAGIAAQADYANAAALTYFGRVLPLLPDAERGAVLVRVGKVLELVGDWEPAQEAYSEALELATTLSDDVGAAWARTWLAEVTRKRGRYDDAAAGLAAARAQFEALDDDAGLGQVLHLAGTLAAQRGDYPTATASYQRSYELRERLGDRASMAALLSNLAIVAEYQGDYSEAVALGERALALRLEIGDRWAIGISHNNLGMVAVLRGDFAGATERFAESMRLHQLVGDGWMVALGHNNLGNALRGLGDVAGAGQEYAAALAAYRGYADDWALAILYEDVAQLAALTGRAAEAAGLLGAAEATRDRIGSPRAPDVQEQLAPVVTGLRADLGSAYDEAVRQGRDLDAPAADALVLAAVATPHDQVT